MKNIVYKEFDAWWYDSAQKELRQSCAVGWGFVVWQASRADITVTLPDVEVSGSWHFFGFINGWKLGQHVVRRADIQAIRDAGLTVEFCDD